MGRKLKEKILQSKEKNQNNNIKNFKNKNMTTENYIMIRSIIGILYWAINIFIRKLHTKNDSDEGWLLVPMWILMPELSLLLLLSGMVSSQRNKILQKF
jgi:hypothetical protein